MVQRDRETSSVRGNGEKVETKLLRIADKARSDRKLRFTSLFHLMNEEYLRERFTGLRKNAAVGVDKQTKEEYAVNLEENILLLVERLHKMSYRPQPARRTYIPKAGSTKMRPLGIPALEDKIVQSGLTEIIGAIYEEDFIEDSYGYRPGRGQHDALRELNRMLTKKPVNYIVEADIKGFFDNVDHGWMMRFLEHRIADSKVLRMVKRFLLAGIMEDGELKESRKGTPQGGLVSPLLANIYLHYVLDLWFEKKFRKDCAGYAQIIRYCDDFVVGFQRKADSERFMEELQERLRKFALEVEPTKTRMMEFGRFAQENAVKLGAKPETLDFLGFTHYCDKTRDGKRFRVKRKTARKKFNAKLKEFKEFLKKSRTHKTSELMEKAQAKLQGHYLYYGVTDNFQGIARFYYEVQRLLHKWLNRRGKRKCLNWDKFKLLLECYPLPRPKIYVSLY
jgi:group II intron reverse transcriptase/maturase